jgi:hypothetical protein
MDVEAKAARLLRHHHLPVVIEKMYGLPGKSCGGRASRAEDGGKMEGEDAAFDRRDSDRSSQTDRRKCDQTKNGM